MSLFIESITERIDRLNKKYHHRARRFLFSLGFWCFKQLIRPTIPLNEPSDREELSKKETPPERTLSDPLPLNVVHSSEKSAPLLSVLVYINGGIGDVAMAAVFLKELHKHLGGNTRFNIVSTQNKAAVSGVFYGFPFVGRIWRPEEISVFQDFDLVLSLSRFLKILFQNSDALQKKSPAWSVYVRRCEDWERRQKKFFDSGASLDTLGVMFSLMNGHTRRTQSDFDHLLGMSDETLPLMVMNEKAYGILRTTGLHDKTFITFQRGVDANYQKKKNIRLWPKVYYEELIQKIKTAFPEWTLVQLGQLNPESDLRGIDIDLRGRTSFEELKVLLKRSALHIDGECGMVHLTHALAGRSAVFFGQTHLDFCGYPENINVKVDGACPLWCEWVTNDWAERCLRGFETPPCMERLTPTLFFDAIRPHLTEVQGRRLFHWQEETVSKITEFRNKTIVFLKEAPPESEKFLFPSMKNRVYQFSLSWTPTQRAEAEQNGILAEYGDILNLPLKNESVTALFCPEERLSSFALDEAARILKPNGCLCCGHRVLKKTL